MRTLILFLCALGTANATGTVFSTLLHGSGQDYADAVTTDAQGNTYVAGLTYSSDFPVTAGAYQTTFGGTCDAFIAKLGPTGTVIWATFLGGILSEAATGIVVDNKGDVWVAGWTVSTNFPLANPIQNTPLGGYAAFVSEFDPTGAKLLFSTFLGGQAQASGAGIAMDSAGDAYVAVNSNSAVSFPGISNGANEAGIVVAKINPQGKLVWSYFHQNGVASSIAVDTTGAVYVAGSSSNFSPGPALAAYGSPGSQLATLFKVSADGTSKLYDKTWGGSTQATAMAVTVDSAGEAWVVGSTASADYPLVHPLANQTNVGARPIWTSNNGGATWTPLDGLPFALPQVLAVTPGAPSILYEGTADLGLFTSTNGGATWTQSNSGITSMNITAIAVDPVHTQTVYAASDRLYKSTNSGGSWTAVDSPGFTVNQILVDPLNTNNIYEVGTAANTTSELRKSTDGGNTWAALAFPQSIASLALDPHVSGDILAISNEVIVFTGGGPGAVRGKTVTTAAYLYRSTDGGNTWTPIETVAQPSQPLIADGSTTPTTFYDGLNLRSTDGGVTWSAFPSLPGAAGGGTIAVDPSGTVYDLNSGVVYQSKDHGTTWAANNTSGPMGFTLTAAGSAGTLYTTINDVGTAGFVSKFSADGSTIAYSTYLRGHATFGSTVIYASEPNEFESQGWVGGIALDPSGNVVVTGGTRATDFPVANPAQATNGGLADAFAAIISANGSTLNYSTYFGGSQDDGALAAAIDSSGDVILVGQTFSPDFPGAGQPLPFSYGDAFAVKLATGTPAITSVLNGASYLPGVEAGSWAMIQGVNLANTTRTWTSADFIGANLPSALSGVSVTIDGKPAFVYYISPTQINVQVPTDSTVGPVNVVVNNNGTMTAPATVMLQTYAPAFFMSLGTDAIASVLPNYTLVTQGSPAHPGDTVVLWGTGFGPTGTVAAAGVEVSGSPATTATPVVTVGGTQVQVLSSLLTSGAAGLYQITIQLPANVPTGTVALQASIGGAQTQAGVTLFVAQ